MEHARPCHPRAQTPLFAAEPKSLGVLIRADTLVQPDGADLPSVPMPVRRDRIEVAIEMVVVDEQALDAGLTIPLPYLLAQGGRARLVQHFVRLDVDPPRAAAGGHRAVRLVSQRPAAAREIPDTVDDADSGVAQPRDHVARGVVRLSDVDHDFVAQLENRPNGRNDRVVERDRVPDDGESGDHVRCGIACHAAGDTARPRRTGSRGFPAPRSGPRRAPGSDRRAARWRAGARSRTSCDAPSGGRSPLAPAARSPCRARWSPRPESGWVDRATAHARSRSAGARRPRAGYPARPEACDSPPEAGRRSRGRWRRARRLAPAPA